MKNKKLADVIVDNKLCKLACVRLIQTGDAEKVGTEFAKMCNIEENVGLISYVQDPVKVLKTMNKIIKRDIIMVRKYMNKKPDLKKVRKTWEELGLSTEELS